MALVSRLLRCFAAPILALLVFQALASAQCLVPDNLDGGPCCSTAQPLVPTVRAFRQRAFNICWRDCAPQSVVPCVADWKPFATSTSPCKTQLMRLRLRTPSGILQWRGNFEVRYSRTWEESQSSGKRLQVWRYLVNGDLRPTAAAGAVPCPVPACALPNGNRVRFTGYIDVALNCGSGAVEYAWMLNHDGDLIEHAPGFARSGAFHPDRSYTFVGPSAGFLVGALQPIEGGSSNLEAVRRTTRVPGTTFQNCEFEEPIQTTLNPLQQLCMCPTTSGLPAQYNLGDLGIFGACGTVVTTPGVPFLPGFVSKGIGRWTNPNKYPGVESLRWNAGGYDYADPCTGATGPEVFFGVSTIGGFAARQILTVGIPSALPPIFVDQSNSVDPVTELPVMNLPYTSNKILNLNY
jgi:hypothetical protein